MGVYYNFYLERKIDNDKWMPIKYKDDDCFYYVRSYAREFYCEYGSSFSIAFDYMNEVFKKENLQKYNNANNFEKKYMCSYYYMDLDRIASDYHNKIHEYGGIISKLDYKKLKSKYDYEPTIIDETVYAQFKDNIKENYIYYEWDTYYGEYYYLYEIMPIIEEILKANNLKIEDVRLLCSIS